MTASKLARRGFLKNGVAAALGAATFPMVSPALGQPAGSSAAAGQATSPAAGSGARIKIDFDRQIGTIDRNIYGNFTEHLGRCIYGGIYDEGSPLSDSDGFRKDVL